MIEPVTCFRVRCDSCNARPAEFAMSDPADARHVAAGQYDYTRSEPPVELDGKLCRDLCPVRAARARGAAIETAGATGDAA